eukprot:jgi/Mesen1/3904/ME000208S02906
MSGWNLMDSDNALTGWSSLDDMVCEEFGSGDDQAVPTSLQGNRRKRSHKDQGHADGKSVASLGSSQRVSYAVRPDELKEQQQQVDMLEDSKKGDEILVMQAPSGHETSKWGTAFRSPSNLDSSTTSMLATEDDAEQGQGGGSNLGTVEKTSEVFVKVEEKPQQDAYGEEEEGGESFPDEDPTVVSGSCHFSLVDVGPAEGDAAVADFFRGDDEDESRNNLLGFGWGDCMNNAGDMDNLFRTQSAQEAALVDPQQWLASSPSPPCPATELANGRGSAASFNARPPPGEQDQVEEEAEGGAKLPRSSWLSDDGDGAAGAPSSAQPPLQ